MISFHRLQAVVPVLAFTLSLWPYLMGVLSHVNLTMSSFGLHATSPGSADPLKNSSGWDAETQAHVSLITGSSLSTSFNALEQRLTVESLVPHQVSLSTAR